MWWQVISEQSNLCLHNVQHLSTEIHSHVRSTNCCQTHGCLSVHRAHTDVKHDVELKKSKNNNWGEAGSRVCTEGVQRRHSCGCWSSGFKEPLILVWLYSNSSPWDFTLWFHGMGVGVKMGDINRCAISTGRAVRMYICMYIWEGHPEQGAASQHGDTFTVTLQTTRGSYIYYRTLLKFCAAVVLLYAAVVLCYSILLILLIYL